MKSINQDYEGDGTQTAGYRSAAGDGLSDLEFSLFSELIESECGFMLGAEKRAFVESRLRRRMTDLGITHAHEYYSLLKDQRAGEHERAALLDTMMICETSFFRNMPQFNLLKEVVLPGLKAEKERAGTRLIRVWSAGCSTGQEPYSLAILINEALENRSRWGVRIFACDLSYTALERAESGQYRRDQLKGVAEPLIVKYFNKDEGTYRVAESARRDVIFDYHNLIHDSNLRGLDVIFCRNVLIYFTVEHQRRLIDQFTKSLMPGGYLFLGHAESLQGLSSRFQMVHRNKGIAYRLDGEAETQW